MRLNGFDLFHKNSFLKKILLNLLSKISLFLRKGINFIHKIFKHFEIYLTFFARFFAKKNFCFVLSLFETILL